jgi:hypothetical protein
MPYPQLDRGKLVIKPLSQRPNKLAIARDHVDPLQAPSPLGDAARKVMGELVDRIKAARRADRPVVLAFGAHTIKNGLAPVLIRLMEQGWVTHLATNGAGIIHDWEFAYLGESSEDVRENVSRGEFGIWQETGSLINLALVVGAFEGLGYGESIGKMIEREGMTIPSVEDLTLLIKDAAGDGGYYRKCEVPVVTGVPPVRDKVGAGHQAGDYDRIAAAVDLLGVIRKFNLKSGWMAIPHPWKAYSAQAAACRLGIPFTGHPMIGHDIIYNHPMNHGAAIGRTALRDFLSFAESIRRIQDGVYLSVGSAVMSPMIFEKAFSMSQNLALQAGTRIDRHFIAVVDLAESTWDWQKQGEPPKENPAYYLRYCKTFSRMGGTMRYLCADNRDFLLILAQLLGK